MADAAATPSIGDEVQVLSGKYEGQVGNVEEVTAERCTIRLHETGVVTGGLSHAAVGTPVPAHGSSASGGGGDEATPIKQHSSSGAEGVPSNCKGAPKRQLVFGPPEAAGADAAVPQDVSVKGEGATVADVASKPAPQPEITHTYKLKTDDETRDAYIDSNGNAKFIDASGHHRRIPDDRTTDMLLLITHKYELASSDETRNAFIDSKGVARFVDDLGRRMPVPDDRIEKMHPLLTHTYGLASGETRDAFIDSKGVARFIDSRGHCMPVPDDRIEKMLPLREHTLTLVEDAAAPAKPPKPTTAL